MSAADPLRKNLQRAAAEKDPALRGVRIAAVVARALGEAGLEPTLVGGAAVAFYTEGNYTTQDVDLVAPSGPRADGAMQRLGLLKRGKDYVSEDGAIHVGLPSAVVDRLCAFKFWKSGIDGLNALIMLELGRADRSRVESRAGEENVLDALDHVEDVLETALRTDLSPGQASDLLNRFLERR